MENIWSALLHYSLSWVWRRRSSSCSRYKFYTLCVHGGVFLRANERGALGAGKMESVTFAYSTPTVIIQTAWKSAKSPFNWVVLCLFCFSPSMIVNHWSEMSLKKSVLWFGGTENQIWCLPHIARTFFCSSAARKKQHPDMTFSHLWLATHPEDYKQQNTRYTATACIFNGAKMF